MKNQSLLGGGPIGALCAVGRAPTCPVAGVRNEIWALGDSGMQGPSKAVHRGPICALAAERDPTGPRAHEAFFASASEDGRVVIWSLSERSGLPVKADLRELDLPVHDLSWGPARDERGWLAAALDDGTLWLWHPGSDETLRLGLPGEPALAVDWFPDGQHLASAGTDGVVRIWKLPEGSQAAGGLLTHYNEIHALRVSRCGRYVAFLSRDEKGAVFDLDRRGCTAFGEPGDPVVSLAWHPAAAVLVGGTESGRSLRYDVENDSLRVNRVYTHLHPAEAAAFAPDGTEAYTGGREGIVMASRLDDAGEWVLGRSWSRESLGYALSVCWFELDQIAAGYSDGRVAVWNPESGQPKFLTPCHSKPVYALDASPAGRALASGSVDKSLKIVDVPLDSAALELSELHAKPIYGVSYSPDGRFVATGSGDTYLVVYDVAALEKKSKESFGREEYWHFAVTNRILNCVAWSPAGSHIAVGLSNHRVVVLPVDAEGHVTKGPTLEAHEDSVSAVAWSRDGRSLFSVGYDRRIAVWEAGTWKLRAQKVVEHRMPIQALAVHPGGRILATGSWDGSIRLWSVEDLRALAEPATWPHFSAVEGLDFSRDGRLLASASSDGAVGLWRLQTTGGVS